MEAVIIIIYVARTRLVILTQLIIQFLFPLLLAAEAAATQRHQQLQLILRLTLSQLRKLIFHGLRQQMLLALLVIGFIVVTEPPVRRLFKSPFLLMFLI